MDIIYSNINFTKTLGDKKERVDIQMVVDFEHYHVIYVVLLGKVKVVCYNDLFQIKNIEDIQQVEEVLVV